ERPYMQEKMPAWGFLLSDAYISLEAQRPSLTALQIIESEAGTLGYLDSASRGVGAWPVLRRSYRAPGEDDHLPMQTPQP
ncbi:MAG TPA: hypothetical protein VN448_02870, partial [Gammaproteobacteria bacterium]|nr:hypothetical protein [Gammaproteobacteria bacterium]